MFVLVDTSIWIDHISVANLALARLLSKRQVLTHPFVIGEIAVGSLRNRSAILEGLNEIRKIRMAHDDEVLALINSAPLFGKGIGYVDAHLLASVRLTPGSTLWTRDKRLLAVAQEMSVAAAV